MVSRKKERRRRKAKITSKIVQSSMCVFVSSWQRVRVSLGCQYGGIPCNRYIDLKPKAEVGHIKGWIQTFHGHCVQLNLYIFQSSTLSYHVFFSLYICVALFCFLRTFFSLHLNPFTYKFIYYFFSFLISFIL